MGNKLLLADDSITIQKVVGIIFANEDYELTVVDNGIAALEKAREVAPDIILIDALMPSKNGYEVCEEVRQDPALKYTPLLLLTGAFEPFDEERARQCGADDSISKPFESQHLIDKVRALIAQGKERAATQPEAEMTATVSQVAEIPVVVGQSAQASPSEVLPVTEVVAAESTGDFFTVGEEGGDIFAGDLTVEEVVEVTPEEDLWGAFDVEEVREDEPFAFEATAEAAETAAVLTPEEEFFFAEEEPGPTEAGTDTFATPQEFIPPSEPVADDIFTFADEPSLSETAVDSSLSAEGAGEEIFSFANEPGLAEGGAEPFVAPREFIPPEESGTEEFFSFAEEIPAAESSTTPDADAFGFESGEMIPGLETTEEFLASAAIPQLQAPLHAVVDSPEVEQQFAPEEEHVPAVAAPPAAPAAAVTAPGSGELTLSDEQLAAIVSRISRDVLEKIAWEVVPDLAETIIREEISKIKEGR